MRMEPCGTDVLDALSISHMSPVGHDVVCSLEIFFSITPLHQTDARAVQVFAVPRPSMQFPLFLRCSFSQISYLLAISLRLDGKSNLQDDDGIQKIQSACHLSSSIKVNGRRKNSPANGRNISPSHDAHKSHLSTSCSTVTQQIRAEREYPQATTADKTSHSSQPRPRRENQ
ncbi:hypothetical protein BKA81DRAFT_29746 [Phyllosticta paracitricarpa]